MADTIRRMGKNTLQRIRYRVRILGRPHESGVFEEARALFRRAPKRIPRQTRARRPGSGEAPGRRSELGRRRAARSRGHPGSSLGDLLRPASHRPCRDDLQRPPIVHRGAPAVSRRRCPSWGSSSRSADPTSTQCRGVRGGGRHPAPRVRGSESLSEPAPDRIDPVVTLTRQAQTLTMELSDLRGGLTQDTLAGDPTGSARQRCVGLASLVVQARQAGVLSERPP
jgi:hypothetical protein